MTLHHKPDVGALMALHWPVDGPHDAESCVSAATAVAELVRYLNHATRRHEVLPFACDGYDVAGRLAEAAGRLPQLLLQLCDWAYNLAGDPTLRHDEDPYRRAERIDAAPAAGDAFMAAWGHASELARALEAAQNQLAPLWNVVDDAPEGGEQR